MGAQRCGEGKKEEEILGLKGDISAEADHQDRSLIYISCFGEL